MAALQIFRDPSGFELDSLGRKRLTRITDGDTPFVELSIRMLSIDTPEVHYPGNTHPARHDEALAQLAAWIEAGKAPIDADLAAHLHPKLASGRAGTLHRCQGEADRTAFQKLLDERLRKSNGRKRRLFLWAADQPFDNYSAKERARMTPLERATFNQLLVAQGWAAPFLIYSSLTKYLNLKAKSVSNCLSLKTKS